jgi:D-3-phosphoglycerate dehydrogenase
MTGRPPVVVALGPVDPALVARVLDGHCRFVPDPGDAELAVAAGAIVRAEARVDQALLDRAPALRVIARTEWASSWSTYPPRRPGASPW